MRLVHYDAFEEEVRHKFLVDHQTSRVKQDISMLATFLMLYGNLVMREQKLKLADSDEGIYFDIDIPEPYRLGMIWAYNPYLSEQEFFWKSWHTNAAKETAMIEVKSYLRIGCEIVG